MAKDLPYFRFTPQEWQNGDVSLEEYDIQGFFINVCCYYWIKDCSITLAMLHKKFSNDKVLIETLIELYIIGWDEKSDFIEIAFLNEQYDSLSENRKKRQEAGRKGGLSKSSNAKAMLKQKPSYKDKDKDKENDKEKIGFDLFFNPYHIITKQPKTDKEATKKYWAALSEVEKQKAIDNIQLYYDSINDKKYCKKARTYLSDKSFNDEFKTTPKKVKLRYWTVAYSNYKGTEEQLQKAIKEFGEELKIIE